jgi:hypothetical protein
MLGVGLHLIGIPNAILWAVLTLVLRFLPYVGIWISAFFPLVLSIAISTTWHTADSDSAPLRVSVSIHQQRHRTRRPRWQHGNVSFGCHHFSPFLDLALGSDRSGASDTRNSLPGGRRISWLFFEARARHPHLDKLRKDLDNIGRATVANSSIIGILCVNRAAYALSSV